MHIENEISLYVYISTTIILRWLNRVQIMEDKRKFIEFASILNLLSKGKPIINYEDFQPLYEFLKL